MIQTGKRNVVIVDAGNGSFAPVDVAVGRESGDLVEIVKGLEAGQKVVVSGQFLVDSEANLKGALARISGVERRRRASRHGRSARGTQDAGRRAAPRRSTRPKASCVRSATRC